MATDKLVNKKLGKKIKFALIMKKPKSKKGDVSKNKEDGKEYEYIEVRTLKELRENFDIEEVMESFLDKNKGNNEGECKLSEWLDDRYYKIEADAIREWRKTYDKKDKSDEETNKEIVRAIYKVFDIKPDEEKISTLDLKRIEELDKKEEDIQKRTNNRMALTHISQVARNQEEMEKLSQELINQTGKNRNSSIYLLYNSDENYFTINETDLDIIRYVGIKDNSGHIPKIKICNSNGEYLKEPKAREIRKNKENALSNLIILAKSMLGKRNEDEEIKVPENQKTQSRAAFFSKENGNSFEAVRTRVIRYMDAGFPLIYFNTFEEDKADEIIKAVAGNRKIYEWTSEGLFEKVHSKDDKWIIKSWKDGWSLPAAMRYLSSPILSRVSNLDGKSNNEFDLESSVLVLKDAYYCLREDNSVASRLKYFSQLIYQGQLKDFNIFIVSSQLVVPKELENYMTILKLEYLTVDEIKKLIEDFCEAQDVGLDFSSDKVFLSQLANALKGLSEFDIINVLALAISSDRELTQADLELIKDQKKQMIQKTNIMELVEVTEKEDDIGGLENLKKWLNSKKKIFINMEAAAANGVEIPKGMLIVGMPGCGKSMTAKVTSTIFNLPLLRMDMGRIMGKYVGESEENMRRALALAEASSPCILWIDEIEKAFAGISSDGGGGEVATRLFGTFLTWMQEKKNSAFVVATANNVSGLPPELLRKGRFDEIFYVGLPNSSERRDILKIHINKIKAVGKEFWDTIKKQSTTNKEESIDKLVELTRGYSGAEIAGIVKEVAERAFIKAEMESTDTEKLKLDINMDLFKQVIADTSSSSNVHSIQVTLQNYKKNKFKSASELKDDDADNLVERFGLVNHREKLKKQFKETKGHFETISKPLGVILKLLLFIIEVIIFILSLLLSVITFFLDKFYDIFAFFGNKVCRRYKSVKEYVDEKMEPYKVNYGGKLNNRLKKIENGWNSIFKESPKSEGDENAN